MLTLHKATQLTKSIIKWSSIAIVAILALVILVRFLLAVKEFFFPTPPTPPTVGYGKLPPLTFDQNATNTKYTYSIDTVNGRLPVIKNKANIRKIRHPEASLLGPKRANERAKKVGFTTIGTPLSESIYLWTEQIPPYKRLTLDIVSFNFSLTSNFLTDPDVVKATYLPNKEYAIKTATSFLSNLESLPATLDAQKTKTTLLAIQNGQLTPATSFSKAQIIRVDFFLKDVDELPIFHTHPPFSSINLLIASSSQSEGNVVKADFHYYDLEDAFETYPIKTAEQAFKELQERRAYIASYYGQKDQVGIKEAFLAYYFGETKQDYLMPIIVFSGNDNFFAYISAVTDEWIEN